MTAALTQLAQDDVKYQVLPITWIRVMHSKGSGYDPMSDTVIDAVIKYSAAGASGSSGGPQSAGLTCEQSDKNILWCCSPTMRAGSQRSIYCPHVQELSAVPSHSFSGLAT